MAVRAFLSLNSFLYTQAGTEFLGLAVRLDMGGAILNASFFFVLYLYSLFPEVIPRNTVRVLVSVSLIGIAYMFPSPIALVTPAFPILVLLMSVSLAYPTSGVVRATIQRLEGSP